MQPNTAQYIKHHIAIHVGGQEAISTSLNEPSFISIKICQVKRYLKYTERVYLTSYKAQIKAVKIYSFSCFVKETF